MTKLSIIIPCYNEAGSLPKLVNICMDSTANRSDIEYVFVNNGSKDNSQSIFNELLCNTKYGFAKIVNVPVNKGYGYGILQGLYNATGDILAWTHADLQTDPKDVILAFDKYRNGLISNKCIVKGNRIGRNIFDDLFTKGMSLISTLVLRTSLNDVNAQPKIFNKIFLERMSNAPFDFSLDLYLLFVARREKFKIETYPVHFDKRQFGEAKGGGSLKGKYKLIKRTFSYIFELRKDIKNGKR